MTHQPLSPEEVEEIISLRDRAVELEKRIVENSAQKQEIEYLVATGDLLFKYYDIVEHGDEKHEPTNVPKRQRDSSFENSILRFFCKPAPEERSDEVGKQKENHAGGNGSDGEGSERNRNSSTILNDPELQGEDRASLLDKYKARVDNTYLQVSKLKENEGDNIECPFCGSNDRVVLLNDGCVYCNNCFTQESILIDHEKPSYKDPPKEIIYYAYKRINHFNEWLNQIQGKETTDIPDEVYDCISYEFKKEKINNMALLTRNKIKSILKKLRINKYYEHAPHIKYKMNGVPVPHMSPELEDRLRHMFCQIQVPFLKYSPPERKNFLSYSYVLHKFMELLEEDQYLESFPLLKSRDKLYQQDQIWQKICADLGWAFYKSI